MRSIRDNLKDCIIFFDIVFSLLAIIGYVGVFARRAMGSSRKRLPLTHLTFSKLGYLPIRDHYYEPLVFNATGAKYRETISQLLFDNKKDYSTLTTIAQPEEFSISYSGGALRELGFAFNNGSFESGDAEVLYYFVRHLKPEKIVEVGAGNSSLIIQAAMKLNAAEGVPGEHIIIEPYENPWLEKLGAQVIRERVESIDQEIFKSLQPGDVLFIDSSHVIRSQNDCVSEYTEIFPSLASGVVVHIHDIFTPFDYPEDWLNNRFYLWGEQYVLEAILVNSGQWEILAALNWLSKDVLQFKKICPFFEEGRVPGSMWIKKK